MLTSKPVSQKKTRRVERTRLVIVLIFHFVTKYHEKTKTNNELILLINGELSVSCLIPLHLIYIMK